MVDVDAGGVLCMCHLMRSFIALPIALTIVVPSRAYSQTQRTLQGIVRDSATGETLPSATIVVSGTDRRAQTNRDGFFALVGVAAQELSLRVTAIGYRSRQMTVAEDWPGTELLTVRLVRIPYELTAIDVVADETRMVRRIVSSHQSVHSGVCGTAPGHGLSGERGV
jgi:hypothetical protein